MNVRVFSLLPLTLLLGACGLAPQAPANRDWLAAWGSAQLPQAPSAASAPAAWQPPLRDVTLRQVVRTTVAGSTLRVQFSNLFGKPLGSLALP